MEHVFDAIAVGFEGIGAGTMVVGFFLAIVFALIALLRNGKGANGAYRTLKNTLGGSIMLGLEILIAADLLRTITSAPSLDEALTLGLIVLIRTVLSMSISIELEGVLPWRRALLTSGSQLVAKEAKELNRTLNAVDEEAEDKTKAELQAQETA